MSLLEEFHRQIRLAGREDEPRDGLVQEADGPVLRTCSIDPTRFAMVECPAGLGDDPDRWISRQVDFFTGRGQEFEWKTYDYAIERGHPFVRVDCTADSLPILTRLGLQRVATTVPATFTP